jgi:DNA-binding NarL/FixJ family response regulator
MRKLNALIIEDHHLIVNGYRDMLVSIKDVIPVLSVVGSCEKAYDLLKTSVSKEFDLVFLDWSLPPFEPKKIYNGGDLVPYIRRHSVNSKIIIITSHTDAFTLYQIIKETCPDALLCKTDCRSETFPVIYETLISDQVYYSQTVIEQVKQITSREQYLDNYNRQIIILLSKGIKTKNLPQFLPLSISSIDKRKAQIRDYFLINKGGDDDIVNAARNQGLI